MKSKDITELLISEGIDYKTQRALEPNEFSVLFDKLTRENQINGIEDYLDGVTYIPSKAAKPVQEKKPAEEKPATEQSSAQEKKPAGAKTESVNKEQSAPAKAESVSSTAANTEVKPETKNTEEHKPAAAKPEPKVEAKPEVKAEAPADETGKDQPGQTVVAGEEYTVQRGDSLWKIAAKVYGRGNLWGKIFEANPQIKNSNLIYVGQKLTIPAL